MDGSETGKTATGEGFRALERAQLTQAARDLFGTFGYARTTTEALCRRAGVPVRILEEEYGSLEGLLVALHDQVTTKGLRAAEEALLAEGMDDLPMGPRTKILFEAYVKAVTEDPHEARVTFVEVLGVSHRVDAHVKRWRDVWVDFLTGEAQRAVARGEAEPGDHRVTVMVTVGTVHEFMAHYARRSRRAQPAEVSEELVKLALSMLGITAGSVSEEPAL
ncbi:TetR/AcrR family transcriptional regulator [uncultured Streptomyces sp.]|uniref:TetR/AcrR family transcriptional regulator n=1 Tax=uncultured Streptomyces sp. TaxID=174707 RepID=UPI0026215971|nr:TetR/AcrR family transcriptional regulator [uncultured Streptomyces sp.]